MEGKLYRGARVVGIVPQKPQPAQSRAMPPAMTGVSSAYRLHRYLFRRAQCLVIGSSAPPLSKVGLNKLVRGAFSDTQKRGVGVKAPGWGGSKFQTFETLRHALPPLCLGAGQ